MGVGVACEHGERRPVADLLTARPPLRGGRETLSNQRQCGPPGAGPGGPTPVSPEQSEQSAQ
jgi:hypothetical protein